MRIRFRIQSYSSQNDGFPIGNLLSRHSPWESERFCDYPQQITVSFYQPTNIKSLTLSAHSTKIASRINILYHLPEHNDRGFMKYGYITFSEGNINSSNPVQVKELSNVDIKATQIRLIILRNHNNKHNVFNQAAISLLDFIGTPFEAVIPTNIFSSKSTLFSFDNQINIYTQLKNNFIKREQFQQAKQIKQILSLIGKANNKMNELQAQKQSLIKKEDYMGAKKLKQDMLSYKSRVTELVNNIYDPQNQTLKAIKSDEKLRKKIEELNLLKNSSVFSEGSQPLTPSGLLLKHQQPQSMKDQMQVVSEGEQAEENLLDKNQSAVSYEDRIIPAVMSRINGMNQTQIIPESSEIGDNQFFENSDKVNTIPSEPQQLSPANQANSSHLLQFYDSTLIRKLHSKYWQFRLQVLQKILQELKQNQKSNFLTKNRLRSYLFVYSLSIKSNNYQVASASLQIMNNLAPIKPQGEYKTDLHNELENSIKQTLKKLNDSNQKIKSMAQKTLLRIIESPIFGVFLCYSSFIKSYNEKVTAKVRKIKIQNIEYMVQKYGVGENCVPYSVVDFALKSANDQDSEVRKSAIALGKTIKQKGGRQRLQNLLQDSSGVKSSIAKKLSS